MTTPTRTPTSQLFSLEGKTVIATGGTGGLGSEMCLAMAESGADIVSIHMKDDPGQARLVQSITAVGRRVTGFACNVGDTKALRDTFQQIWDAGIVPDVLLNAAGLNNRGPVVDMTDDRIDEVFAVNLKGSYVAAQEFGRQMIKLSRPGKIINIGSYTSFVALVNVSAYAATKGGVLQMTKAMSNEWAPHGIQVNCICPGFFHTPLAQQLLDKYPDFADAITKRTPTGRWGEPMDLRGTALFLSTAASDFVTGTSILVDGGMMAY